MSDKCSVCGEELMGGFNVVDGEGNSLHPSCAPAGFKEQAKAERLARLKAARAEKKVEGVSVLTQRKIEAAEKRGVKAFAKWRNHMGLAMAFEGRTVSAHDVLAGLSEEKRINFVEVLKAKGWKIENGRITAL